MLSLSVNYDVLPDRLVTIKLPETVRPGRHELLIVVEENNVENSNAKELMQFAGSVAAFNGVDGVTYQRELREEWS